MYPDVRLYIDGAWCQGTSGRNAPVINPATEEEIGTVAHAETADLERAVTAARKGFETWRKTSSFDRYKILRKAADLVRERADEIGPLLTLEQGKPVAQSKLELLGSADVIDWCAEEARRAYGRAIPSRADNVEQVVLREPVGLVAAFTPWNFPVTQATRKIAAALAAGCSVIIKCPEETPASCMALVQAFADAGVVPGALNLVYGVPAEISEYLIPHPAIRKVSFTGSTVVGKRLAALAGQHMKRATMELGGHSPAIVFEDADVDTAVKDLSGGKFRNCGQICSAPSRFLVHEKVYGKFVDGFVAAAQALRVGNELDEGVDMGPLANVRRLHAMERLVADAVDRGAKVQTGGKRQGNRGFFFEPTVLTEVSTDAQVMNEEPFGPIVPIVPWRNYEAMIKESNRLAYGLAAFAYTRSGSTARAVSADLETGMVSINHHGLAFPETPFGGVKDSGYGHEGGIESLEPYMISKFVTHAVARPA